MFLHFWYNVVKFALVIIQGVLGCFDNLTSCKGACIMKLTKRFVSFLLITMILGSCTAFDDTQQQNFEPSQLWCDVSGFFESADIEGLIIKCADNYLVDEALRSELIDMIVRGAFCDATALARYHSIIFLSRVPSERSFGETFRFVRQFYQ